MKTPVLNVFRNKVYLDYGMSIGSRDGREASKPQISLSQPRTSLQPKLHMSTKKPAV